MTVIAEVGAQQEQAEKVVRLRALIIGLADADNEWADAIRDALLEAVGR
jgi:hypothetical protein